VTNNDTARTPYRVTVVVTWTSKSVPSTVTQQVKIQSLFWSPTGCASNSLSLHPFATPCSAFFYGQAQYPAGSITVAGTVNGTTFQNGTLLLVSGDANLQQEQVAQIQGSLKASGISLTDTTSGTRTGGSTSVQSVAVDADPASTMGQYTSQTLSGTGGNLVTPSTGCTGSNNCITFAWPNDGGTVDAATSAGGSNICPPAGTESDGLPCGGGQVLPAGTASVIATFNATDPVDGATTIVQLQAPASATTMLADRDPVSGQDGIAQETVTRRIGQLDFGMLPAWITANCASSIPSGFTSFAQLAGYVDSTVATAGSSAAAPTAVPTAGTLKYWTGTNAAATQTTITMANSGSSGYGYSIGSGWTSSIGCTTGSGGNARNSTATMSVSTGTISMSPQPATSSTPSGSGSILRNDVQASAGSPVYGVFHYVVTTKRGNNATVTALDVTITVDLATITSRAVYQAAPTA
jgi:hypothetical protein